MSLLVVTGCNSNSNRTAEKFQQDVRDAQAFDPSLTFSDLVLEQADETGKLLWKVNAKQAVYSKDKKVAMVVAPAGELYQDGKAVFKISGDKGEVVEDGKSILLKGKITAIDLRDGLEIKGNELEWRPSEDILLVRNQVTGKGKQMVLSANSGKFFSRSRRAEMEGKIVADVKDPKLQMRTDRLTWLVSQEKVIADRPIQIDRYRTATQVDRATADKAEFNLKTNVATLQQNSQVNVTQPVLQVKSNVLTWETKTQTIRAPEPLTAVNSTDQVTISANQGEMLLDQKTAFLTGNVRALSQRNQANVRADRLVWYLDSQEFAAEGNVNYKQINPVFQLIGSRAKGRLQDQQVTVTGGTTPGDNRVVTEVIPNTLPQN